MKKLIAWVLSLLFLLSLAACGDTQEATTPNQATPSATTPAQTTPAQTTPAQTTPAPTEPADTTPAPTQPADTTPAPTEPADTTPAQTEPPEPVDPPAPPRAEITDGVLVAWDGAFDEEALASVIDEYASRDLTLAGMNQLYVSFPVEYDAESITVARLSPVDEADPEAERTDYIDLSIKTEHVGNTLTVYTDWWSQQDEAYQNDHPLWSYLVLVRENGGAEHYYYFRIDHSTCEAPNYEIDEELADILALGLCAPGELGTLDGPISARDFYDRLLKTVRLNRAEPTETTLLWQTELTYDPINRADSASYLFWVILECYFGEDLSYEPWNFGAHEYAKTLNRYVNRCGEGIAFMEHKLANEGDMDAIWSWGAVYCAIQLDPYSMQPLMDVNEEGYFRSGETITKGEALRALYRAYRAHLWSESIDPEDVEPLVLTEEQQKKAAEMPDATYDNLPDWRGNALDNKTFTSHANNSLDMFTRADFEILADLGFDFTRIFITHEMLFDLTGDRVLFNSKHLDNMDDAIGYAIENGIHVNICLYDFPGFAGASMDAAGFTDEALLARVTEAYAVLAEHYKNVPNSVLSFNLFNEPWLITEENEEDYANAVRHVADAIWEHKSDRLIFVDGIAGSQKPAASLAGEPFAQAFHMYGPEQFVYTNWVGGVLWYQGQQWPLPYANGMLDPSRPLTLQGTFPAGTRIEVLVTHSPEGTLTLEADGAAVATRSFTWDEVGSGWGITLHTLEADAAELVLRWDRADDALQIQSLAVIYPETTDKGTPLVASPWASFEYNMNTVVYDKMTVIYCDAWCLDGTEASTLVLHEDGTYKNPGQADLLYGKEYLRRWLEPWLTFREETGTEIMIQEWGIVEIVSNEGGLAYLRDWVALLDEYDIPWNKWGSYLETRQLDVEYEDYRGFSLNRGIIEAIMGEPRS